MKSNNPELSPSTEQATADALNIQARFKEQLSQQEGKASVIDQIRQYQQEQGIAPPEKPLYPKPR